MSGDKSTNEDMWQAIMGGRDARGNVAGTYLNVERQPQPPKCADPELEALFERMAAREMAKPKGPDLRPATHCKQGHEYAVVGVYKYANIKTPACRECRKVYRRQWWAVRKEAAAAADAAVLIFEAIDRWVKQGLVAPQDVEAARKLLVSAGYGRTE